MLFHYSCISQQLPAVLWVVWRDPKDKDKNLFGKLFLRWKKKEGSKHSDTFTLSNTYTHTHTHTHTRIFIHTVDMMENFSVLFYFFVNSNFIVQIFEGLCY